MLMMPFNPHEMIMPLVSLSTFAYLMYFGAIFCGPIYQLNTKGEYSSSESQ